jgi:hypothetical protein
MENIQLPFDDGIHGRTVRIIGAAIADKVMQGQRYWIAGGNKLPDSSIEHVLDGVEAERFNHDGAVRVTTGSLGTEIKWSVFSPCFASLFYVIEWLSAASLPIVLRFYLSGWFEETCFTVGQAINRIEQIIAKSELHLTRRTFVEEFDPKGKMLPPILQKTWADHTVSPENSIDCVYEEQSRNFRVDRIGSQSTIAKYYGMSPVSYACKSGNSYDEVVSEGYAQVLRSGKPRYDHVLAAMRMPDNIVRWVPYQRIVVPRRNSERLQIVSVVAEIANVEISLI